MLNGQFLLTMLNGDMSMRASEIQVEWGRHDDLSRVLFALELVELGVLGQRGSLVVEVLGGRVGLLHFVFDTQDQITILDHDMGLGRVDIRRQANGHGHVLGTVRVVKNAGEQVGVRASDRLLEWDLDDQMTVLGHEANELVGLGVRRQQERLFDLTLRVVIGALDNVLLNTVNDQLVANHFGLDRLGRETSHIDADAVLLWYLWHHLLHDLLWSAEPVQVTADHMVQLIERVEQIQSGDSFRMRMNPLVHIEHRSRKETVRKQSHCFKLS